jgi:predicted acetylornithine/succinylornithine family transaminase
MDTYKRYPVRFVRGEGLNVFDTEGRAYVDFAAGIAAMPIGHSHPRWVAAVKDQLDRLVHVSNLYETEAQERLAERLIRIAGFGKMFLSNSGAEANEALLKIVRRHGRPHGRTKVVCLEGSFHGRTIATLAATGQPEKQAPFQPMPGGFVHVPPNDVGALDRAVDLGTAAVFIEPILGEGGVLPVEQSFLEAARELCHERGALLCIDEVQTGVGRTGRWFAYQGTGVQPDAFTLAKALAGGLPIGATIARSEISFEPGQHASTFGGGPVPCVAALTVLDVIEEEGLLENARVQGDRLAAGLTATVKEADVEGEPRGRGLLLGVPVGTDPGSKAVVLGLLSRGFLATEAGPDVVRCTPPLTVDAAAVDSFVDAFGETLKEVFARPMREAAR